MLLAFGAVTTTAEGAKPKPKPVSVFPAPNTPVASDTTTFSFRGLKPGKLGKIKVIGSVSGRVGGTRLVHSDRRGVSFVPKKTFKPGETVKVYTKQRIRRAKNGDFSVTIGQFYGNEDVAGDGLPIPTDGLKSRPDLKPPAINVLTRTADVAPGMMFFAPKKDGLMITDNAARVRWMQPTGFDDYGTSVLNFQTQKYRGKPVLTYWKGGSTTTGFSQVGKYEILNNRYQRIAKFGPGNGYRADIHEFTLTPRNTALVLAYRGVKWDLSSVGGATDAKIFDNVVQEVDIKTGAVLFEWHSLGNVGLRASSGSIPIDGTAWDYFHVNSASPDGDSLLVSGRRSSTIYRIDRKTARTKWRLRGDGTVPTANNFDMGWGTSFAYQHDARRLPNGDISLFDNGSGAGVPTVNPESSGLVLRLSNIKGQRSATVVRRFENPDHVVSGSQGNTQLQPNGNYFVGWGNVSRMTEFAANGDLTFDATFGGPVSSYRAYKSPWVGYPTDQPAIASEADGPGAKVYASWNGATVKEWKVMTGADENSLTEAVTAPWTNLETEITVPTVGAKVQVVAYNYKDKKIGQSALLPVGP